MLIFSILHFLQMSHEKVAHICLLFGPMTLYVVVGNWYRLENNFRATFQVLQLLPQQYSHIVAYNGLCHLFCTTPIHQCVLFWPLCLRGILSASIQDLQGNYWLGAKYRKKKWHSLFLTDVRSRLFHCDNYQWNVCLGILSRRGEWKTSHWAESRTSWFWQTATKNILDTRVDCTICLFGLVLYFLANLCDKVGSRLWYDIVADPRFAVLGCHASLMAKIPKPIKTNLRTSSIFKTLNLNFLLWSLLWACY